MWPPFDYFDYRRDCQFKQNERKTRFASIPSSYLGPLSASQRSILQTPIADLVSSVHSSTISPLDILRAYGKNTVVAHKRTNCVTELLLPEAEKWVDDVDLKGPLAGIPVSLKDTLIVGGFDTSVGYSCHTRKPYAEDGVMVKLLKKAGAIPHAKCALPITLLSYESTTPLWGVAKNPHNHKYSPGGSTGGDAALLALNGSRIAIGSDVAGSVRCPAAWSGCYSIKCSIGRWPKSGFNSSMPGQEGIPSVYSPLARTLDDLIYFTKSYISMKPWEMDYSVHPIPWRDEEFQSTAGSQKLRIGVMMSDGVVPPSPAIRRAINMAVTALKKAGHVVVDVPVAKLPQNATPEYGLQIASVLLCADGGKTYDSFRRTGETTDPGSAQLSFYQSLPRPVKYLWYLFTRYVRGDPIWARMLRHFHPLSAYQNWQWVAKREAFRAAWFDWWDAPQQKFDFLITPANATPALPHGCMHDAVSSCGYSFLFNLLDYSAGVIPVTKVDPVKDALSASDRKATVTNGVARGAYKHYDSREMAGLPCAVQIVGRRLTEEKTLACMLVVEEALKKDGVVYEHLDLEELEARKV